MIEVRELKKHFRTFKKEPGLRASIRSLFHREFVDVKALDGISLDVKQGEIRGFIGPNGAGKSTTIKILSGVLYPTSGYVNVNGFEPWKQREKYVKNIGVVFGQKQQLWLDLPSVDTFHLNKEIYDIPEEKFKANRDYFVKLFDLQEIIIRPARQLSLGEKMKCELIAALLHDPKIVFLDEPTIGLDVFSKEKIRQFIKKVNKDKGITFLLTTHDLDDIENLCQKITIINQGKIIYDDTLQKIKADIDTKILDIKFSKALKEYKVPEGIKILSKGDMEIKIEVDKKKHKVDEVIGYILKHYAINDINVSNPEIDDVIKKIYQG
jgi:ABC-2 type transport system ATP-binding protein